MDNQRPDPEKILEEINRNEDTRGKLKIFLGMSAGVGKTYEMLSEAIAQKKRGVDIVCGYIEPHGRKETEELAKELEKLPLLVTDYRGINLKEFALDAALSRKPKIILVDELAHTNQPGSRHQKRWQDIEELLAAGIGVYTTVNVQHIESLRDVVARVTGVTVNETVPDAFIKSADEIEVVDIPPDELIQRIHEGKVYHSEKIEDALKNFFQRGNLIALRELMLRHTAEQVDAQMREYRTQNSVKEIWPTRERIMVCVAPNALSSNVVRTASRIATSQKAEIIALSIESSRYLNLSEAQRQKASEALRLAESLGAETIVKSGEDIVNEIITVARERNVSSIVMGKPVKARWKELIFGSVVDELVRKSGDINIYIIPGKEVEVLQLRRARSQRSALKLKQVLQALAVTLVCTLVGQIMAKSFEPANIIMVYLLGVSWLATRLDKSAIAISVIISVAAFDFFFVPPHLTFAVSDWQYLVTFLVMFIVGSLISSLTLRIRAQTEIVREREKRAKSLFELTRKLLSAKDVAEISKVVFERLRDSIKARGVIVQLSSSGGLILWSEQGEIINDDPNEDAVVRWVLDKQQIAGLGTATLGSAKRCYFPLVVNNVVFGALGIKRKYENLSKPEKELLETFVGQISMALEKLSLLQETTKIQLEANQERLRNTLLSSVSHDLRTPLASITGASSALIENENLEKEKRIALIQTISEEASRLTKILRNILDMTKIESGSLRLNKDWYSIEELVGSALDRLKNSLFARKLAMQIPENLPLIKVDGMLIEQVFVNLLENSLVYTEPDTVISITAYVDKSFLIITLLDQGTGITYGDEERIFEKLYRSTNSKGQGFGLGLAICKAILEAHNAKIIARNHPSGGAEFVLSFPIEEQEPNTPIG